MNYEEKIRALTFAMTEHERGNAKHIQHFLKVHAFALLIADAEGIDAETRDILSAAALVHDIGINPAKKKYGSSAGTYQELEGPAPTQAMMEKIGFDQSIIDRVKYLVAHHHTYTNIDGADYQILVEADFLVNLFEGEEPMEAILAARENIFRTEAGKKLLDTMFDL